MADYSREMFEGLKQATDGLTQANEGLRRAVDAALQACDQRDGLRETVQTARSAGHGVGPQNGRAREESTAVASAAWRKLALA